MTVKLRQVPVRVDWCIFDALKILALDQTLNTLFDHVDLRLELRSELVEYLSNKLLMRQFFALPIECSSQWLVLSIVISRRDKSDNESQDV